VRVSNRPITGVLVWEDPLDRLDLNKEVWGETSSPVWKKALLLASKMASVEDETALIDQVMDDLVELTQAERAFLLLRDGDDARVVAARNLSKEDIHSPANNLSWAIASHVFLTGNPVVTINAMADPKFKVSDSVNKLKLKSILCLPLKTHSGQIAGAIYLDNRSINSAFTGPTVEVLESFCEIAAQALKKFQTVVQLKSRKQSEEARYLSEDKSKRNQKKEASVSPIRRVASHLLVALITLGSLLFASCSSSGPEVGAKLSNAADDPVPIFALTFYSAGIVSEDTANSLGLETVSISIDSLTLISDDVEQTLRFVPAIDVSLMEDGELQDTAFASFDLKALDYNNIEFEISDFSATGTKEEVPFTYSYEGDGVLLVESDIDFTGADEEGTFLAIDLDAALSIVDEDFDEALANNPDAELLEITKMEDFEVAIDPVWNSLDEGALIIEDADDNGILDEEEIENKTGWNMNGKRKVSEIAKEIKDEITSVTGQGGEVVSETAKEIADDVKEAAQSKPTPTPTPTPEPEEETEEEEEEVVVVENNNNGGGNGNGKGGGKKK